MKTPLMLALALGLCLAAHGTWARSVADIAGMRERADRSNLRLTIDGTERKVTICC